MAASKTLRKDREFQAVLSRGRSSYSATLKLRSITGSQPDSRYGLIISTKVSKKATERNKIRRRLRAVITPLLSRLSRPSDLVFLVQPNACGRKSAELREEVEMLLARQGLL